MSEKPIGSLRARMIEDMTVRNFVEKTKNDYIRHVKTFAAFLGRSPHITRRAAHRLRRHGARPRSSGPQVRRRAIRRQRPARAGPWLSSLRILT